MLTSMDFKREKKICIFSHFFSENYIPVYVKLYLNELIHHFDEILLVTNTRNLINESEILHQGVSVLMVANEGYDLGMFYRGFQHIDTRKYEQIACINDSNVLFGPLNKIFEWAQNQKSDFWGLVDSYQKPPFSTHLNNYHIQSHFIVFNKAAIAKLLDFFNEIKVAEFIKEPDIRLLKKKVINDWEIGLTQYLLSKNLSCKSYIDSLRYQRTFKIKNPLNISLILYYQMIKDGVPLIKKRVINSALLRYNLTWRRNWKRLIRRYGDKTWEIDQLISELTIFRREYFKAGLLNLLHLN